jgi:LPS-assembly lipoprotein
MNRLLPRLLGVLILATGLSGCGFHLRNKLELPSDLGPVKVSSTTKYSKLALLVERGLDAAGAEKAPEDATEVASLQILSERWGDMPIAVDEFGRAQEFSLRYAAVFVFRRADGSVMVPQQVVELSRDYVSQAIDSTGTNTERETLVSELQREMSASILRRVDGVLAGEAAGRTKRAATPVSPGPASRD